MQQTVKTKHFTIVSLVWEQTNDTTWRSLDHPHVRGTILFDNYRKFSIHLEIGKSVYRDGNFPTLQAAKDAAHNHIDKILLTFIMPQNPQQ